MNDRRLPDTARPARSSSFPRRELMRYGLAGLGGLSLPALLRHRAEATPAALQPRERTAVILVWQWGGASHLETYDPKPLSGSEYRGPYQPISTRLPGLDLCELLPRHAQVADKFTIVRSLVHTGFCHTQGPQQILTGHPIRELKFQPEDPDFLSIANYLRSDPARRLPNFVAIPGIPYLGPAYLGIAHEGFSVNGDLNDPNFQVPNISLADRSQSARLRERMALRQRFERFVEATDQRGSMQALDTFESQAWNMLSSSETRRAFDIGMEDPRTRDRYGRNPWGQQCLLARRLVEAGVDLVSTTLGGPVCGRVHNWDDHAVNHNVFEAMKLRAPLFDQAVAALIEDLFARGLDKRVLLIVAGDFGRTPKISYDASTGEGLGSAPLGTKQPGRDHWPHATSLLFSGGGIPGGQVLGATDARGEYVVQRIIGVQDFLATVYRHLGIDAEKISINNFAGRPIPILNGGRAIPELMGRA